MTISQRLKFWNSSVETLEGFTIEISFLTSSGYEIITQTFPYKLSETIFYNNTDRWGSNRRLREIIEDKYRKALNDYCKNTLLNIRKKGIRELKYGQVIKGKHIVKCNWNIDTVETGEVTYEQFKEYINLLDREYDWQLKEKKWLINIV
jgi:hypothetical protein